MFNVLFVVDILTLLSAHQSVFIMSNPLHSCSMQIWFEANRRDLLNQKTAHRITASFHLSPFALGSTGHFLSFGQHDASEHRYHACSLHGNFCLVTDEGLAFLRLFSKRTQDEETQPVTPKAAAVALKPPGATRHRESSKCLCVPDTEAGLDAGCRPLKAIIFPGLLIPFPTSSCTCPWPRKNQSESPKEAILENNKKKLKKKYGEPAWVTAIKEYISTVLPLVILGYVRVFRSSHHPPAPWISSLSLLDTPVTGTAWGHFSGNSRCVRTPGQQAEPPFLSLMFWLSHFFFNPKSISNFLCF